MAQYLDNNNVLLSVKLGDANPSMYVRAFIYDKATDLQISVSPIDLIHIADGLYAETFVFPMGTEHLVALYVVYSDAGYTTRSASHPDSSEQISRDFGASQILSEMATFRASATSGELICNIDDLDTLSCSFELDGTELVCELEELLI